MAKLWFVERNHVSITGPAAYDMPLADLRAAIPGARFRYIAGPYSEIRITQDASAGSTSSGRYVLCEVTLHDATDLAAGFYLIEVSVEQAMMVLGPPAKHDEGK